MNRLIRGPVVLAVALVALSCKGDPTSSLRNGVFQLIGDPGALFLRPDSTKPLIVGAVDEQGNQIQVHFTLGTVTPGLTVIVDPAFNLVYDDNGVLVKPEHATREQFLVTATAGSGDLSFVVNGGGKSVTIPVRLLPDSATAVLSNATPATGEVVTLTLSPDFIATPGTGVSVGGFDAIVTDVSVDGSTISFVPQVTNLADQPMVLSGILLTYLSTPLDIPATGTITTPGGYGTGPQTIATAPTIAFPAGPGETTGFSDSGPLAASAPCGGNIGAHCRYYRFDIAADVTFTLTATWNNTADIGIYFVDATGADQIGDFGCDAHGSGATAQPESCTETLPAGTYYIGVADFTGAAQDIISRIEIVGE